MTKRTAVILVGSMALSFFLLLFSYETSLLLYHFTLPQQETLNFLQRDSPLLLSYSPLEISHLQDVQQVMQQVKIAWGALAIIVGALFVFLFRDKDQCWEHFYLLGRWSSVIIAIFLVAILLFFPLAFTLFHTIFFPQGNWLFSESSLLIKTFPQSFFVTMTAIIFGQALGYALLMMGTFCIIRRIVRKKRDQTFIEARKRS